MANLLMGPMIVNYNHRVSLARVINYDRRVIVRFAVKKSFVTFYEICILMASFSLFLTFSNC